MTARPSRPQRYRRLGGVAAVNRSNDPQDRHRARLCLGTDQRAIPRHARTLGFHIDACEVRAPQQKGKTERRVGDCKNLNIEGRHFNGLEVLQAWTDADPTARAGKRICPATGLSVTASWEAETPRLRPLPELLPQPFDQVKPAPVPKHCRAHDHRNGFDQRPLSRGPLMGHLPDNLK